MKKCQNAAHFFVFAYALSKLGCIYLFKKFQHVHIFHQKMDLV